MMKRNLVLWCALSCLVALPIAWTLVTADGESPSTNLTINRGVRVPLSVEQEPECIPSGADAFPPDFMTPEQRSRGGVVVHLLIVCYACAMTAIVCDEYFVPALEAITARLKLSPDVAGATFMAMGASAPELFSSIAGSFVTEDDIGLGTILGSAIFNVLGISGIVGIVLWNKPIRIEWYPVVRDCLVYGATVVALGAILLDNVVRWWEALCLLVIFALYIVLMHFNARVEAAVRRTASYCGRGCVEASDDPEKAPLIQEEGRTGEKDDPPGSADDVCSGWVVWTWRASMWLPSCLFRITIPPLRSCYPATFVASIAWMGALSYVAVWMVTIIGSTLSIPDSVSGLTLLALGSSVPDLIATVLIAKRGEGNMAVSNLLGSNTFDLAFCLGAPWFVKALLASDGGGVTVYSSALIYTVCTLLATLLALLATFRLTRWRVGGASGLVSLALYAAALVLACLYELNVFAPINAPLCAT